MTPEAVFSLLGSLGGRPGRVLVIGCEPASVEEGSGLSPAVAGAVDEGVALLLELVESYGRTHAAGVGYAAEPRR